ncbi:anti-sigma factor [Nocardioides daejeonensis]|uniref:anti-sigma factor n=1 Tax=Nocardioides daejeonensis TaxID=1046556 RepID=UPI000D741C8E|nr:anti-sigma factor [Nocardioides daejeonensis]
MNDIHALTGAYAVDALDAAERLAFEEHLATCADCRTEVSELTEAAGLLTELVAVAPAPRLRSAVLAEIDRVRPLPPLPSITTTSVASTERDEPEENVLPLRRRPVRAALVAAAAAAALIGGGLAITQPWQDEASQQLSAADRVLAAADAEEVTLDFPDGASARLVRSAREGRAVLVTHAMPAAPRGRDYQLWLQTPDGKMVDAGLMPDRADQTVLLTGDASRATGAGITVEPDGGSPQPTTEPIAFFDLSEAG